MKGKKTKYNIEELPTQDSRWLACKSWMRKLRELGAYFSIIIGKYL
jgi:hypothetical protein